MKLLLLLLLTAAVLQTARARPQSEEDDLLADLGLVPQCKDTKDVAELSDDDFLSALTGGCQEAPIACERGQFQCVPYFRCDEQNIVSDRLDSFDIRILKQQFEEEKEFIKHSECLRFNDVCCTDPLPADTNDTVVQPPFEPQCGRRNVFGVGARIVGFKEHESQFGEFPWMAAVLRVVEDAGEERNFFVCGGSLIHPQVVMTAAHCINGLEEEKLRVRLGEWDTQRENELFLHHDIDVATSVKHPDFDARRLNDDIALLILTEPAPLQEHIDTLCLPERHVVYDRAQCVATGWGKSAFETGQFQTVLKQIDLPHVPHAECQQKLRKTRLRKYFRLDGSFTCAGGEEGEDACTGDGGSPLACRDPSNPERYVQLGVVSWGIGCGLADVPGVYADVQKQLDWVQGWLQQVETPVETVETAL